MRFPPVNTLKKLAVMVLFVTAVTKSALHDWVVAATKPSGQSAIKLNNKLYVRPHSANYYIKYPLGNGYIIFPLVPKLSKSNVVLMVGNIISVYKVIPSPFIVVAKNNNRNNIQVDDYRVTIRSPCVVVIRPKITGLIMQFPVTFIINGKSLRNPNNLVCKNTLIIISYSINTKGFFTSTGFVSIISLHGKKLIVNKYCIQAPKGVTIKWVPIKYLSGVSYEDITSRWPHWPYSL